MKPVLKCCDLPLLELEECIQTLDLSVKHTAFMKQAQFAGDRIVTFGLVGLNHIGTKKKFRKRILKL
ncbi:hypothetical protein [Microvirga sp. 2TAF3]|uniref:hypothetical protein n=1 Tax=Microvirga sp. 2TAF3 TaxID=3233014 RepID=UPI003F9B9A07